MHLENHFFTRDKILQYTLYALSLFMVLYYMVYAQVIFASRGVVLVSFVHFSLLIVFINSMRDAKKSLTFGSLLTATFLTLFTGVYILINIERLIAYRWSNTTFDLIVGVILIAIVYYAGVLCFGKFVPGLVMVIMVYPFVGQYLPEPFTTNAYSIPYTISNLSIGIDTGVFDTPIRVAVNYIFLFLVFGSLLGATKVSDFFSELGRLLFGKLVSGPALIATLNSALIGSVVGSAIANVSITGVYTIPAMKKAGYKPEQAGAIEVAASNGGQILPPVMGVVAFAMAGFAGIPYIKIVVMAIIPALLYYMCVFVYSHLNAIKNPALTERTIEEQKIDYDLIKYKAPSFVIPLILIIYLLWSGYSVAYTAFWAIICVIVVSNLVPKKFRLNFKDTLNGLVEGAISGSKIGAISAVVGIMLATFTGSGLGLKLSMSIETWSGGVMFFALLIIWAVAVMLGMIGVAVTAYYMAAAFMVPVLVEMGIPYETAHFFIVFPTAFALMTPPIAMVSIVASRIAESDYIKTSIEAVKAAIAAFILPFLFVYSPALLMQTSFSSSEFWFDISAVIIALVAIQVISAGYLITKTHLPENILLVCTSILCILYLPLDSMYLYGAGILSMVLFVLIQILKVKKGSLLTSET